MAGVGGAQLRQRVAHERREVARYGHHPGLRAARGGQRPDEQQVLDEPREMIRPLLDLGEQRVALIGRKPVPPPAQQLRAALDRRERRAQLVADDRQHVVFHPRNAPLGADVVDDGDPQGAVCAVADARHRHAPHPLAVRVGAGTHDIVDAVGGPRAVAEHGRDRAAADRVAVDPGEPRHRRVAQPDRAGTVEDEDAVTGAVDDRAEGRALLTQRRRRGGAVGVDSARRGETFQPPAALACHLQLARPHDQLGVADGKRRRVGGWGTRAGQRRDAAPHDGRTAEDVAGTAAQNSPHVGRLVGLGEALLDRDERLRAFAVEPRGDLLA